MAEFSRLVITNKGQALIAKIMTGKGNIAFTKVSASNAECVLEELEALTELSDIRQTVPISKISRTNEVAIIIETVFHNLELTEGYHMRALGLYAADPDEGEILYAVTMEISGSCYMPAYNGIAVSEAYIKLVTTVGNSENVSLEVDLAAVVTVGDMNSLRREIAETYLPKDGDSSENIVTFESGDSENVTSWTDVPVMESKEKHKSLLAKIATMFKNVRFLYKLLGNEDISKIADGTVTGVLKEFKEGKVNIISVLKTMEQVDANTSEENIVNALVFKALKMDLMNSINQINSNLSNEVEIDNNSTWKSAFNKLDQIRGTYGIGIICYFTPDHSLITPPPNTREAHLAVLISGYNQWRVVFDADIYNSQLYWSVFSGDEPDVWHELL